VANRAIANRARLARRYGQHFRGSGLPAARRTATSRAATVWPATIDRRTGRLVKQPIELDLEGLQPRLEVGHSLLIGLE